MAVTLEQLNKADKAAFSITVQTKAGNFQSVDCELEK